MIRQILVFKNLNKNTYYFKVIKGYYSHYYEGYINQYEHQIVLIIPFYEEVHDIEKPSLPFKIIEKIMYFLEKLKERW